MTDLKTLVRTEMGRAGVPSFEMDDIAARRDRKRRNQRLTASIVGLAVFVAAVWVVTSGDPSDRSNTPGGGGQTVAPDVDVPVGLIGLPPEDASPSSPAGGELVVGFGFGHTGGDPGVFSLNVYADGRVIWRQVGWSDIPSIGWVEQHLTPEGMELIRSELLSTRLFEGELHLASGRGLIDGKAMVRDGDRLDRITWGDPRGTYDGPTTWPTPEQANAIILLDARLRDLPSWLPASAWEDQEPRPFVPSRYAMCYSPGLDQVLGSLPRSAAELVRSLDRTHDASQRNFGCPIVTTDEARSLAEILDDADTADIVLRDVFGLHYKFGLKHPGEADDLEADVDLWFRPMLPHEL